MYPMWYIILPDWRRKFHFCWQRSRLLPNGVCNAYAQNHWLWLSLILMDYSVKLDWRRNWTPIHKGVKGDSIRKVFEIVTETSKMVKTRRLPSLVSSVPFPRKNPPSLDDAHTFAALCQGPWCILCKTTKIFLHIPDLWAVLHFNFWY